MSIQISGNKTDKKVPIWKQPVPLLLAVAFALTVSPHGVSSPAGVITPPSMAFAAGVVLTLFARFNSGKQLIPMAVLSRPVVFASLCYFALGVFSGIFANDKYMWWKEVVQRTMIIILPMLLFSLTPKKPEQLKFAIMSYLPLCLIIVVFAGHDASKTGMEEATYTFGMHKNQIAGSCSIMSTIAIAAMITSSRTKMKAIMCFFALAGAIGCFASQGKAGLVCIIIATMFMFVASRTKPRYIAYFVITCVIAGAIMWKVMPDKAREHVVSTKKWSTTEIRLTMWSDILPVLQAEPFSAVGWGNPLIKVIHGEEMYYGDCANVLLYDWMQLSLVGPFVLIMVIFFGVKQGLDNARRMPVNTVLAFVNLVALGVVCGRFTHAMVDTFWIGRGVTLTTWAAIGMLVFVKLYLDQTQQKARPSYAGASNKVPVLR
ncbi:MAG TPA: O-antigen ligase family protein [Drouetiella sp.]